MYTFTDEETARLQRLVTTYEQAQRDGLRPMLGRRTPTPPDWAPDARGVHMVNPPRAGTPLYEPGVMLPRVDWTAVAIAAVTVGLLCGVWLGVAWLVFRRLTDA